MAEATYERLRQIRWSLLNERDRLTTGPMVLRNFIARAFLTLIVHLISLPIYLTQSPQASFTVYARRRGDTYLDSYAKFKQAIQFSVGVVVVSIVAIALAVIAGTAVRTKLFD